jgi:hypothetical protein
MVRKLQTKSSDCGEVQASEGCVMARKTDQSSANIEDLTDAEISAAIRYLDPDLGCENGAPGGNLHPYNLPQLDHFILGCAGFVSCFTTGFIESSLLS